MEDARPDHHVHKLSTRGSHAAALMTMTSLDGRNKFLHMTDCRIRATSTRENCEYVGPYSRTRAEC